MRRSDTVSTGSSRTQVGSTRSASIATAAKIDERVDELPATRTELINHHVQKILEEAEADRWIVVPRPEFEALTLVITYHQHKRETIMIESADDDPLTQWLTVSSVESVET